MANDDGSKNEASGAHQIDLARGPAVSAAEQFAQRALIKDSAVTPSSTAARSTTRAFWGRDGPGRARLDEALHKVLSWNLPWARWFEDGELNLSANCLDRHLATARRTRPRSIWEGEPGEAAHAHLPAAARRGLPFANVLKALGVAARRSRRDLPADDPRGGDRHARLRAHRRHPTRSSSAASRPRRCATASTTRRQGAASPPTAAGAAARSSRSRPTSTRRSTQTPDRETCVVVSAHRRRRRR